MPDRILRDELWLSDRFLDLPTDMARLAFLRFISAADDFGNMEGGLRRLSRMLQACSQLKNEDAASGVIDSLMAADLIRRYVVDGRELFHIPRFKSHKQYLARRYPASPWCDPNVTLGKQKRQANQQPTPNVVTTSLLHSSHVAEGVGVGVGVGVGEKKEKSAKTARATRTSPSLPDVDAQVASDWIAMRRQKRAAVTETAIAGIRREAEKAGLSLQDALAMCCARGWTGFKADWVTSAKSSATGAMSEHGMQTMRNAQALKARLFDKEQEHAPE